MPKGVVTDSHFDWSRDVRPNTPWSETVIYEAHTKGLTKLFEEVQPSERGTFAALGNPKVIDHLKRLGVTAIELLPIHTYIQDRFLQEKGLRNYWGYNTLNFFTPERSFFATDSHDELRRSIRRLHAAGIEVILDVVYNHTCEGSEQGPTLSWRGLDNASYYRLVKDDPPLLDQRHRHRQHAEPHKGPRNPDGRGLAPLLGDQLRHRRLPLRSRLDTGPDGHRLRSRRRVLRRAPPGPRARQAEAHHRAVGHRPRWLSARQLPPGFAEWNDKYRDTVRKFWRGDHAQRADLAARLTGSADLFDRRARRPWASVNLLGAHDGYTLADTVAYEERHNEANGEDNNDGHSNNCSRNWGVEGPTEDPAILETRSRVMRSMLTTLFASLGTPMLVAGDELGRTQNGNNNAYCQDNEISWLDWNKAKSPEGNALIDFTARLIALRRDYPMLRAGNFLYGEDTPAEGLKDIEWWDERGLQLTSEDWENTNGRALVMRRACERESGEVQVVSLLLNASEGPLTFHMPPPAEVERTVLIDSSKPEQGATLIKDSYELPQQGAALLSWTIAAA
ncbi:alpha-amylase family glycosyl hydrolase [Sphingomonas sp. H160509]|uniref:glycogen debranching protein n=1 Tax=Sphingomonas sp. H160509 TaxID=2955313 RepID=UPI0020972744|nr:alpha-amylase family glycosyl hydrolase [Sphingomonas sp. H160509]MDD1452973.1 alpha-amylase family glycosyl hydrolase [Sphingomonas sp. H160509]